MTLKLKMKMKMKLRIIISTLFLVFAATVQAQLAVAVSPARVSNQKVIVPLALTNSFAEKIESARAVVFLMDEQGRMVGQRTDWIIGGTKDRPALESGKGTDFNFVVTAIRPLASTNVTTRVTVSRILLEGGKAADVNKDVKIQNQR